MPLLTIAAATVNSPDWNRLFIQAVRKFTKSEHEILIIDNGSTGENKAWLKEQLDVRLIENADNEGHGGAMDQATRSALGRYLCFLDIDSHPHRAGWETDLVALYEGTPNCRLIGVVGPEHKPLHPPLFFFEPRFIIEQGLTWRYQPEHPRSTDTAQKVYWDIIDLGYGVVRLEKGAKVYDHPGDEVVINGASSVFHGWYGSRFQENGPAPKLRLDGIDVAQHIIEKQRLFDEPQVKEILSYRG